MNSCRCCGADDFVEYLDLGNQPLANSYHKGESLPVFPLKVKLCRSCFLSCLTEIVDPDTMFRNYLYVSGTTYTLRNHWKELAADAVSRVGIGKVLDIACNDGMGLEQFKNLGCDVLGVDPAINLRKLSEEKNINVIVDYWRHGLVPDDTFDIITAANVFAHVHDTKTFLEAARIAIKQDGLVILEFPYCREMIEHVEFDTIYHEHLSYFLVNPICRLVERVGMHVADIMLTPIHGGSIRFFLSKNKTGHCDKLYEMISSERNAGLLSPETYLNYGSKVEKNKNDLLAFLKSVKGPVIGYGASAKGNTFLNFASLKYKYVADDNPMKWGYLTPGMNIPIVDPKELANEADDIYIVLTAWNFAKEIKKKVRDIRGHDRDKFVFYVPDVHVE